MTNGADRPLLVLTTLPDHSRAVEFVRSLVRDRLVACGTVLDPARSIYRWEGTITEESEAVVLLKTTEARWADLEAAVSDRHPYDVPELLAVPAERGLEPYLQWIRAETT